MAVAGAARAIDEADLVMAAAVAWRVDPAAVLAGCDLPATIAIAGTAACAGSPVDAAAAVLGGILARRPFRGTGRDHQVVAWLACAHVLARAGLELPPTPSATERLLDEVDKAGSDPALITDVLAGFVRRRPGRLTRSLRRALRPRTVTVDRWRCPECEHTVRLGPDDAASMAWLGAEAGGRLLRGRCSCRRGGSGGPRAVPEADELDAAALVSGLPVVEAPHGPEGALLALGPGGAVAFVPRQGTPGERRGDDGAVVYEVAAVGAPGPSDLVGHWGRLVVAAGRRTEVGAHAVRVDERTGHLDVRHLAATAPEAAALLRRSDGSSHLSPAT